MAALQAATSEGLPFITVRAVHTHSGAIGSAPSSFRIRTRYAEAPWSPFVKITSAVFADGCHHVKFFTPGQGNAPEARQRVEACAKRRHRTVFVPDHCSSLASNDATVTANAPGLAMTSKLTIILRSLENRSFLLLTST